MDVPSHSPPGLIQTKASSRTSPVLVVGRTPNPVPFTLHQSPLWEINMLISRIFGNNSPSELGSWLNSVAASIHDKVSWEASSSKKWCQSVNVSLLVTVGIALGVGGTSWGAETIIVGDVSGKTTNCGWAACGRVEIGEKSSSWLNIGCPS